MNLRDLRLRARALVFRKRVDRDLEDELGFHVEMEARKNLAAGLPEAEARRRARVGFGPKPLIEDQCRDARGLSLLETAWQDGRYAVRSFRRAPAFSLTVICTIALGLGLNTALFTLFNAYVLRPFAVTDPYSLYGFTWTDAARQSHPFTWREYQQFRRDNPVFSGLFAARSQRMFRIDGRAAYGELVTGEYFHVLGVNAALGRVLTPDDTSIPGREAVVVLSHGFWQRHFASDPNVIGRKIMIRGYPCEIVGVLGEGFAGLAVIPHDFWAPLTLAAQLEGGPDLFGPAEPRQLEIAGRLKPGVTRRSAEAALIAWAKRITADRAPQERAVGVVLESRATSLALSPLLLLFAPIVLAFALVLLIACANVANMMLARSLGRQREIGIRLSLGAARSRVIRQLLTESALLSVPAAALGLLLSDLTVQLAVRSFFATMPAAYADYIRFAALSFDARVVAFMFAAAVGSAVLFGLAPALQATRPGLVQAARGDFFYKIRPSRPSNVLVVIQITASVCLLVCAGVLLRGSNRFRNIETGLRTSGAVEIYLREEARQRVLPALRALPIVTNVGAVSTVPLDATAPRAPVTSTDAMPPVSAGYRFASPEFFQVFDIGLRQGRHFTAAESVSGSPVAIVSETAARRLWPDGTAVGRSLLIGGERAPVRANGRSYVRVDVVGIAADIVTGYGDRESDKTAVYLPTSSRSVGTVLIAGVRGNTEMARRSIDETLSTLVPGSVDQIHSMDEVVAGRTYPLRLAYWAAAIIGALALVLTVSGVYGLLSYVVSDRTKEMGIRMALGASASAVKGLILKQVLRLSAIGIVIGAALALSASAVFGARLIMLDPFDLGAFLLGSAVVLAACVAAGWLPARRATLIDPVGSLRHD